MRALSPAEKILAQTPEGAATIQDYHRKLFKCSEQLLLPAPQKNTRVPPNTNPAPVTVPPKFWLAVGVALQL